MAVLIAYESFDLSLLDFHLLGRGAQFSGGEAYKFTIDTPPDPFVTSVDVFGQNIQYSSDGTPLSGDVVAINFNTILFGITPGLRDLTLDVVDLLRVARSRTLSDDHRLVAEIFDGDDMIVPMYEGDYTLLGFDGDDTLRAGGAGLTGRVDGPDRFDGGRGTDTVDYTTTYLALSLDLARPTQRGGAAGDVYVSIERFVGTQFDDAMRGASASDSLDGGRGDDILLGRGGNDSLTGGEGDDRLTGGAGYDTIIGGAGRDTLVLEAARHDIILAFDGRDDTIELGRSQFSALRESQGHLKREMFHRGTAARDADDHIIYDAATKRLFYDADGNGTRFAPDLIALMFGVVDLSHRDIDLV